MTEYAGRGLTHDKTKRLYIRTETIKYKQTN